jgi:DnaJ-class molecular chaperone
MSEVCSNFRPYNQSSYTKHLGCANCGKMAFAHKDICHICHGTGRKDIPPKTVDGYTEPEQACDLCVGTGRESCKNAFDDI